MKKYGNDNCGRHPNCPLVEIEEVEDKMRITMANPEETTKFLKPEDIRRMIESVAHEYDLQKKPFLAIMHPNDFKKLAEKIGSDEIDGYIFRENEMVEEGKVYIFKRKDFESWGNRISDDNQMNIFDFINNQENPEMTKEEIKPLIEYRWLTWYKTMCPYCKFENPDIMENHSRNRGQNIRLEYWQSPLDFCPNCGKKYDRQHPVIKMSKDYAECEKIRVKRSSPKK